MKIAIVGYGLEGKSSLAYFKAQSGHDLTVLDKNPDIEVGDGVKTVVGDNYLDNLGQYDLIVRTSGLSSDILLEHNPDIQDKITTQLNEFLKACPTKHLMGVTGTKGKGTTSTLIYEMLKACGKDAYLGGNVGVAMLNMLSKLDEESFVVLELSSFQLSDLNQTSPSICACLMMTPEHLDWHGSIDKYVEAKTRLFAHQTTEATAIYFAENDLSKRIASASPGHHLPYFALPGAIVKNDQIVIDSKVLIRLDEIKLLGRHNLENICAAVTAVWQVSQDADAIARVLRTFKGLPHRLEMVRQLRGVTYYNDSFASVMAATQAAIEAIVGPKVVIVGGYDRHLNLDDFCRFIKDHDNKLNMLIIGQSAARLQEGLSLVGFDRYTIYEGDGTMADIVKQASNMADGAGSVILSPGFPSFDMFKNFEDRGEQFKQAVNGL